MFQLAAFRNAPASTAYRGGFSMTPSVGTKIPTSA